jgi:hypothetical protein
MPLNVRERILIPTRKKRATAKALSFGQLSVFSLWLVLD